MKKLLALLLALACVFTFAACAAKIDAPTDDTPVADATPPAADETPETDEPPETVETPEVAESVSEYADLVILDIPLAYEEYAIGFRVGSDLTPVVNDAIVALYEDGTLTALAEKYGVDNQLIEDLVVTDMALTDPNGDLAAILDAGKIVIGITEYAPMNYYDTTGKLIGFDTEFAEAVCAILGVTPEFIEINWDTKEIELAGKQIDCIWNGLTVTEDRRANMDFSVSYLSNEQAIVARADIAATITDAASLAGLTIVAEEGSAGETAALELEGINYIPVALQSTALMEVKAGTADAAIIDLTMANALVK